MDDEITFRDYPIFPWVFALGAIGFGVYAFITGIQNMIFAVIAVGAGIAILVFNHALTIIANKQTRILTLDYRSIILHSTKEIPFGDIETIRMESHRSRSRRGGSSTTYRIEVMLKNGVTIPFRSYYSGDFFLKQKTVDGLRAFMGLAETFDESPMGFLRAAPKIIQAQQEAFTGSNSQERVTNGVHWFIQSHAMGASPVTRWFSPDFKTRDGFLCLAQKVAGQSSGGFLASLGSALFKQTLSLYGFSAEDIPDIAQAETLAYLPPLADAHFTALSSAPAEAQQILNPWALNPIAEWGQRHPLKQFQSMQGLAQLVILFSPNGLYLATLGNLQAEQVDELTSLGVELIKSQGTQRL